MSLPSSRKPAYNLHSPRPAAPWLDTLLSGIARAASAAHLDAALGTARAHSAGSVMELLEQAGAERARFLLEPLGDAGGAV